MDQGQGADALLDPRQRRRLPVGVAVGLAVLGEGGLGLLEVAERPDDAVPLFLADDGCVGDPFRGAISLWAHQQGSAQTPLT